MSSAIVLQLLVHSFRKILNLTTFSLTEMYSGSLASTFIEGKINGLSHKPISKSNRVILTVFSNKLFVVKSFFNSRPPLCLFFHQNVLTQSVITAQKVTAGFEPPANHSNVAGQGWRHWDRVLAYGSAEPWFHSLQPHIWYCWHLLNTVSI